MSVDHRIMTLQQDRRHKDLLFKMTLEIGGIRRAVITDDLCNLLQELLKFRHFKRYYFQFEYDWDKLDYLQGKIQKNNPSNSKKSGHLYSISR